MRNFILLFFMPGLLILSLWSCGELPRKDTGAGPGKIVSLQDIRLTGLDGEHIAPQDFNGKFVFVNFWATWCRPCREEMPSIRNLANQLQDRELEFVFVSDEPAGLIRSFESEHGYGFNYLQAEGLAELGIHALPATFIFDGYGRQVFAETGYRQWDLEENIQLVKNILDGKK